MDYPQGSLCQRVASDGWQLPDAYNIGVVACDDWAEKTPEGTALFLVDENRAVTYAELRDLSNKTANLLISAGVRRGDRIGILLPQMLETAVGHLAGFKMGAITVPLFMLFGPDALEYRILNAEVKLVFTNREGAEKLAQMDDQTRGPLIVYTVDGSHDDLQTRDFNEVLKVQDSNFVVAETTADDPAIIIYTSGTTGSPKGALHGHRVLEGHMTGFETFNNFAIAPGHVIWTPADWAWIGGLFDVLFPALASGMTVLAKRFEKFTAEGAFEVLSEYGVQHAFLPPTALKIMRGGENAHTSLDFKLVSIGSGGETLGEELLAWGRRVLGVTINEFYGQTEANLLVSSCSLLEPTRAGIMGRATAGHTVAVIDADGQVAPIGEVGQIAVRQPDPVIMLGYWNNQKANDAKYVGAWLTTGDMGITEQDGWFRFVGRDDDVITSAGYRIGPSSIEDCLMRHGAVQFAAVVGKPDELRGEIVKAFVVLRENVKETAELISELQTHVKSRLAAHEYPREIAIIDDLPKTATGKIMRRKLRELG